MKSREPGDVDAGLPAGTEQSDLDLVRRAQKNERGAFDLLVLKYQHKVIKLVARLLRDPTEAEDVAQEAFVKAYRALGSFRGDSAFYTWLYRIAVNTARNSIASRQRRPLGLRSGTLGKRAEQRGGATQTRRHARGDGPLRRDPTDRQPARSSNCPKTCARPSCCARSRASVTRKSRRQWIVRWAPCGRVSSGPVKPSTALCNPCSTETEYRERI